MGEGQTQFGVLIIVALVGLAAITAMGLHATDYSVTTSTAGDSEPLVGAATTTVPQTQPDAQLPAYSRMDYNADGVLDTKDSQLLADVIALGGCPQARVCDVDGNGRLDLRDLARFNSLLSEPIAPRAQESSPATSTPTGNTIEQPRVTRAPLPDVYDGEYPSAAILA